MDVQMAVFHCADGFLKQLMVTKLSQCQYALPLLVPDPFTQEIEFPLWTFRQINKSWKMRNTHNEIISKIQPVWKAETPMVSFFKFGSLSLSKSQLMNSLINEKHNTFFHRNCTGSSRTRVLMDGVVEIAWYCPSGKDTDKFTQCVAFCNLHGDAGANEKQLQILTEMSSVNVVILPRLDKNDKSGVQIQKLLEDVSKHSSIRVDEEDDNDCRKGKEAAQQMMGLLEKKDLTEIKELFLPCQGKLWHQWCEKNKELHRSQGNEIDMEIKQKQDMKIIREQQHVLDFGGFIKLFITEMNSQSPNEKTFFLKWLAILLDEYTSADLSALHYKYDEKWSEVLKIKEKNDIPEQQMATHLTDEHTELDRISEELKAATFGLEHILREIGQIYESCQSVNKNKEGLPCNFSSLPSLAAEMMISGFPLELMDGDAAHVPVVWVTAVLHELIKKLGDKRVFVLSVLGIQSSGKSTMLNAMFGLQFAVSAGRCTRGAFMQLIRVSEEMKTEKQLKFDYILVVDTEGLRALELSGRSTRHQDNEMATFVVGLGNMTLINIFGESPSELQDILQIVVQAFMRMKKVRLNPSCMFVHQNVSDITAGEKNMEGRRRLHDTLDKMTKLAAKDEVCDAECFSDVITFDIQKDVKYFAQLWEGSPPMAPPNPSYCENIQELKTTFFSQASKSDGIELTQLKVRINDLWEALLNERFVFSFKNALEIATYRKLETEYSKWSWSLRRTMLEIENKLYNNIENETIDEVSESDLHGKLKVKSEEVEKSMSEFFEKDKDKDILIQWKASFDIKFKELQESIVRETKRKLNEILQQRGMKKKIDAQRTRYENTLLEKSKELAIKLKDKAKDETILKKEFGKFWIECVKNITTETPPIKNIDVLKDMKQFLSNYKSVPVNAWKKSRDVFTVKCYSDYIQLKKSSGIKGNAKTAFGSTKQKFETQIRTLVNEIAEQADKTIMSYNIAKMGYNKTYIQELIEYIKARVEDYEQGSRDFVFTKEFHMDLVISISKRENKLITDQHRKFREANDPLFYFEKKSKEYYSIFQKYCQGATSAAIFGEIICQKLKEPIQKSVYKDTARDLTDEIKTNCESLNGNRSKIEKHILKTLAEEEDFDKYITYIYNPKDHFKSFIKDEVNRYITDNFRVSVRPKMKENIKLLQQKIMAAALRATTLVNTTRGDVQKWLNHFTLQLSDVLIFSVKDLSGDSVSALCKQRCRANPVPQYLDQFETYDPTQKYDHEQLAKIFGKLALQLQATEARKDRAHTQSRLDQLLFLTEEEDETDTTLQQEVERLQNALDDLHRHTDQRQQSKENTRKELNERLQRAEALLERAETEIHQLTQQMAARRPSELTDDQCLRQLSATTHMLRSQDFNTHCAPVAITAPQLDAVVVREKAATIGHHLTRSGIRHRMERAAPVLTTKAGPTLRKCTFDSNPATSKEHTTSNSKHSHTLQAWATAQPEHLTCVHTWTAADAALCTSTATDHALTPVLAFTLYQTLPNVSSHSKAHKAVSGGFLWNRKKGVPIRGSPKPHLT
ncbi:unnamed protein product [Leuciscus chuanchicus]